MPASLQDGIVWAQQQQALVFAIGVPLPTSNHTAKRKVHLYPPQLDVPSSVLYVASVYMLMQPTEFCFLRPCRLPAHTTLRGPPRGWSQGSLRKDLQAATVQYQTRAMGYTRVLGIDCPSTQFKLPNISGFKMGMRYNQLDQGHRSP